MKFRVLHLLIFLIFDFVASGQDTLFQQIRETASEPDFVLRIELDHLVEIGKDTKIIYLSTPFSYKGNYGLQYFLTTLKDYPNVNFDLLYKFDNYPSNLLNPDSNLLEIKVQLAIKVFYPDQYYDYILIRGEKLEENWEIVAAQSGVNTAIVNQLITMGLIDSYVIENYNQSTYLESQYSERLKSYKKQSPFAIVNQNGFDPLDYYRWGTIYKRR